MKITVKPINGNKSLRDALVSEGFLFPCGGKGICGKCRIIAPQLPVTELDRRFLTEDNIRDGVRLACNKLIEEAVEIDCLLDKAPKARKLEDPQVFALLGDGSSIIGLVDDELVETAVLPAEASTRNGLRAVVGKNAVELYEKYGVAKASTILLLATADRLAAILDKDYNINDCAAFGDNVEASLLDLPSEVVYIAPAPNSAIGSMELIELDGKPSGALLVFVNKDSFKFLFNAEDIVSAELKRCGGQEDISALKATAIYFKKEYGAAACFELNEYEADADNALKEVFGKCERAESIAIEQAVKLLQSNRSKAKLNKTAQRTVVVVPADEEAWQDIFANV